MISPGSYDFHGGPNRDPGVEPSDIKKLYIRKYSTPLVTYDPLALGDTNADFAELAFTNVEDLTTEKSAAQLNANWYTVVNTFKTKLSALADWILGRIKNIPTSITAFRTGDVIPVDGPSGTAKMSKDDLLANIQLTNDACEIDLSLGKYWEAGTLDQTTGAEYGSTNALRTAFIPFLPTETINFVRGAGVGFNFYLYCYTASGEYLGRVNTATIATALTSYPTAQLYRIALNGITGTSVSVANLSNIITISNTPNVLKFSFREETFKAFSDIKNHVDKLVYNGTLDIDLNEQAYWEVGAINTTNGAPYDASTALRSTYLRLDSASTIRVAKGSGVNYNRKTQVYDINKNYLGNTTETSLSTIIMSYPTACYYRMTFTGITGATVAVTNIANIFTWSAGLKLVVNGIKQDISDINNEINNPQFHDLLKGKKWYACGDSFTHGDFSSISQAPIPSGKKYEGQLPVYPYLIGNRTDADVQNIAVNGSTIAQPSDGTFENVFTRTSIGLLYTTDFSDADYITLYFGINDSHHNIPIGTIDDADNSTFYGAWNVALDYLTTNYPSAHIGIIVSNGCDSADYPTAEKAIAQKWGVHYLDLDGGVGCPTMLRCSSRNPASATIKSRRYDQQKVSATNGHPNALAHELESAFIETWLKTL